MFAIKVYLNTSQAAKVIDSLHCCQAAMNIMLTEIYFCKT